MKKEEIRPLYIKKRKEISSEKLISLSLNISEKIFNEFDLTEKTISLFLPIEKLNEIDTYLILEKAKNKGNKIAMPKTNFSSNELIHILFNSFDQIETSAFGIPEPNAGEIIQPENFDIVFVPLLAIDKRGNRVGYGKGFYDRFLQKCSPDCLFIGLHLFDQMEEIDDITDTDIRLDFCVTPKTLIKF
jgi:5-formyltetrahydrofolate cyclo-ligase